MELEKLTKTILACVFLIVTGIFSTYAQDKEDVDQILEVGVNDAQTYTKHYMEPFFQSFGYGLANNWYNTAKPHKQLGFDLTISMSFVAIPTDKRTFMVNQENGFEVITPVEAGNNETPTVLGKDVDGPEFQYSYTEEETGYTFTGTFNGFPGAGLKENIGFERIPAPTLQLGVGVFKSTDVILHYIPKIKANNGDTEINYFGVGVKHDIAQWIPFLKRVPIDISVLGAYSKSNASNILDEAADQKVEFNVHNWTAQLLVSKKVSVLTGYLGLGYTNVGSDLDLLGEYEITNDFEESVSYTDPYSLSYKDGNIKATIGARLKFGVFTLHGDYTIQKYNIWTAGIGFAFR